MDTNELGLLVRGKGSNQQNRDKRKFQTIFLNHISLVMVFGLRKDFISSWKNYAKSKYFQI